MRLFLLRFFFIFTVPCFTFAQQQPEAGKSEKKIIGDATLLSNYVWHGLTQTKRNPAIQSSFNYYLAPTFRTGLWGSNVSYYGGRKANALLKINADILLKFSPNFGMDLKFNDNHYFESEDRDGNTVILDFGVFGYNFGIEQEGNWQGTVSKARYHFVRKTWDVYGRWKWENQLGYTTFETLGRKAYFDVKTGIGTKASFVFWQLALTFTDDNSSFEDFADYFFTFSGTATF